MFSTIFWFTVGLIVGWNFLGQPAWVKRLVDNTWAKIKSLVSK